MSKYEYYLYDSEQNERYCRKVSLIFLEIKHLHYFLIRLKIKGNCGGNLETSSSGRKNHTTTTTATRKSKPDRYLSGFREKKLLFYNLYRHFDLRTRINPDKLKIKRIKRNNL